MMGNLIYYVCLASAIQRTGAPVSTMIIGTLPVVLPVFANLLYSQRDGEAAVAAPVSGADLHRCGPDLR
ncbi:putative cationic amino acid transport protein [Klebsiella pneumoniae]|nr:putative cationic amino acid transport protein [Klebsiella pneumoniae]